MLGIALEGGGAKGAYHIGAVKACMEVGIYPPDVIAGTSIGAMNAALLVQGDFEVAEKLWETISGKDVFTAEDEKLIYSNIKGMDMSGLADALSGIKALISEGGVDNTNMKAIIDRYVQPEKLMESPIDFGIVTFALPDFRAVEIFKDEMTAENIPTYILASAAFPGFRRVRMGPTTFVDGGVYDNCPVNMLLERGCDRVIAVRTNAVGVTRYNDKDKRVVTIRPSEDLGSLMRFAPARSVRNIRLGYYDGLKALMDLGGRRYYLTETKLSCEEGLYRLPPEVIMQAAELLKISRRVNPQRLLWERVLPVLFDLMELDKNASYNDLLVAMTENRAEAKGVERLTLYTADSLLTETLASPDAGRKKNVNRAIDLILHTLKTMGE